MANLEVIIGDLRREIGEMGKTLTYLNRHEAIIFKVRRKIGQAFNKMYPKGTRKRKILGYCKNTLLHPVKYIGMYTSGEGKNRIKGDFEIGEEMCIRDRKSGTEYTVSGMVYPEGVSVTVIFDDAAGRIEYRAHFSGSK